MEAPFAGVNDDRHGSVLLNAFLEEVLALPDGEVAADVPSDVCAIKRAFTELWDTGLQQPSEK